MKTILIILGLALAVYGCGSANSGSMDGSTLSKSDTIRIANDSLEYEILIIETGFDSWLVSQPPRGHYSQSFLEAKNRMFVSEYNIRARQPNLNSSSLYSEQINYRPGVDYGYEVNYLLYNYFLYFQQKYNQHLTGGRN